MNKEQFRKLLRGIRVRTVVGKYDWHKAWKYMEEKGQPVTVAEIHRKVMSEVPNRRQVRAWMERQRDNERLAKVTDYSGRVFYLPRSIVEEEEPK